jgi:hypothetical protein
MQNTQTNQAVDINGKTVPTRIPRIGSIPNPMKTSFIVTTFTTILLAARMAATAATINFTGIDMAAVASVSGQNFTYTNGTRPTTGTVNVRQITGTPSSLVTGQSPDATGFYVQEGGDNLSPMVFRFTFDTSRNFTVTQNETLENLEINSFTLPSGSWTVLSASYATTTGSGSNITFTGVNMGPPYGTYSIAGSGSSFDFAITNLAGYSIYGSAISVDVGSGAAVGPEVAISLAGLAVRLRWPSESGKTYQPIYSYDPNGNTWSNLGSSLAGTGQLMAIFDSTESGPKKFYRVQIQ